MIKYLFLLILIPGISCRAQNSIVSDNVTIKLYTYEEHNEVKAAAMPEIKDGSKLNLYKRRFEYLLMNISEIHSPEKASERNEIFKLYPDTLKLKQNYLQKYANDKKLVSYFEETYAPICNQNFQNKNVFTEDELMEVASKFFYCDQINPDTTVQSHVCIGINGIGEADWKKDYTLLSAFCFEAIFNNLDLETSQIRESYYFEKKESCQQFKRNITTLDKYLEDVKLDLFTRMKNNATLKEKLLAYYELNKNNLAFQIIN
jgi:hypothetical protein